jgi:hypothetical protein
MSRDLPISVRVNQKWFPPPLRLSQIFQKRKTNGRRAAAKNTFSPGSGEALFRLEPERFVSRREQGRHSNYQDRPEALEGARPRARGDAERHAAESAMKSSPIYFEFAHDICAIHGGPEDQLGGAPLAPHQPTKKKTTGD